MPASTVVSVSTPAAAVRSASLSRGSLRLRTCARASWSKSTSAFSSPVSPSLNKGTLERKTVARVAEEDSPLSEFLDKAATTWEKTDDKPAVIVLGFSGLLALYVGIGVVGYVDKIPLVSTVFELIGLGFTGWFTYRYLIFKPDREQFIEDFGVWKSKVFGQK